MTKLTVGYIPEHFSTPLFLAEKYGLYHKHGIEVEFKPYPSGSGHLIQSLGDGSINVAVGLTEAFIRGIAAGNDDYQLVGTYVESPLCWAISTGAKRESPASSEELEGSKCGVSRMGSGSDVMSRVLQNQKGWSKPFDYEICNTFVNLRAAVNDGKADFFMWEHFTSNKYYLNGEIRKIGEIYTPWPSWMITASQELLSADSKAVKAFTEAVNEGITYFNEHLDESVAHIAANLDYSKADAEEWLKTVKFSSNASEVDPSIVTKTVETLQKAVELPSGADKRDYVYKF